MNPEVKKLERRARSLLVDKEIPPGKMEVVRNLMNNESITAEERYHAIIELVRSCPDKAVTTTAEPKRSNNITAQAKRKTAARRKPAAGEESASAFAPTETAYYFDYLQKKYRHLKFFKKRYLVHRDNRFGIGIRKRFIPTKRLIRVFEDMARYQQEILKRLSPVLMELLKDESVVDPTDFNYLRRVRSWLMDEPMARQTYDTIKWMERHNFEREFKNYLVNFFAFQRLGAEVREQILLSVENRLRGSKDLTKDEVNQRDPEPVRREKEKKNLEKEKKIYDYMFLLRSFIHGEMTDENTIARYLRTFYGINTIEDFWVMVGKVLIFQRPLKISDIISYYRIETPRVSSEQWDYSDDFLRQIGKDPESRRKRELEHLKEKLAPFEVVYKMLRAQEKGRGLLFKGVEVHGRLLDKKRNDPEELLSQNFMAFLDGTLHYFRHAFLALFDGTPLHMRDVAKDEYESPLFSDEIFPDISQKLEQLLNAMHELRTENPTMVLESDEVTRIMAGQIATMNHIRELVTAAGAFWYELAEKLFFYYEQHRLWIHRGNRRVEKSEVRRPVRKSDYTDTSAGRAFPFFDCTIIGIEKAPRLADEIKGQKVLGTSFGEGILSLVVAYCFQGAQLCRNEMFQRDMHDRKQLLERIRALS